MPENTYKLPLFAKSAKLAPVPGQDASREFLITTSIEPQPEKSMGYLVERVRGREVKIHAWLPLGGAVFGCDAPLAERPDRNPEAGMSKGADGDVFFFMRRESGVAKVAHFSQRSKDSAFSVTSSMVSMGAYGTGAYDLDEIAAACYVLFCILPAERGDTDPMLTVGELLDGLTDASYPDALDALLCRGEREGASGFERYATRSLVEAGAEYVRPIAATHDVDLRRLSSTGLFWAAYDPDGMVDREVDTLQAVEGALNRLVFLEHYLGEESSPMVGGLAEDVCERAALQSLSMFAEGAEGWLRDCDRPNEFFTVAGTEAARGGEWDLRTRFAARVERLRTPFSFSYGFDCDARAGVFSAQATVPAASAFPVPGGERGRNDARTCYALRLALSLAAMAFGSGVGVVTAVVTVRERELGGAPLVSLVFQRRGFTMRVLPKVASRDILDARLSVDELIAMLDPARIELVREGDGALLPVEPIDAGLPERISKIAGDTRPVPGELVEALRADTVGELDIFDTGDDPLRERYQELYERAQAGDAGVAAELADLIATYDAAEMLQDSDAVPLYCANMVSRAIVGRVDGRGEATRYRKVPDTAFDARGTLCRVYRDQGNHEDAVRLGEAMVELAPSTFSAHHALALAYNEAGDLNAAARSIIAGLRVAADPTDISCAYYRLGYWFWQGGDPSLGLACYTMVRPGSYFFGEALSESDELMRENHLGQRPARDEAAALLRAEGVPIAPVSMLVEDSARVAVRLVDAGIFSAAAAYVHFLSSVDVGPNSFDVLASVRRSLTQR